MQQPGMAQQAVGTTPALEHGAAEERASLLEMLDRVLNKGVVVTGDLVISVADVDLIYLGLRLLLTSVETALETGTLPERPQHDLAGPGGGGRHAGRR